VPHCHIVELAGPDKGGYYHEMFLRGKQFLAELIPRVRVKAEKAPRNTTDYPQYPDFETMSHLPPSSPENVFPSDCQIPWKAIIAASTAVDTAVSLLQQQQELRRRLLEEIASLTRRHLNSMDDPGTFNLLNQLHDSHTGYQTPLQRALNQTIALQSLLSSMHF